MNEVWAKSRKYRSNEISCDSESVSHYGGRTRLDYSHIENAKKILEKKGVALGSFGYSEACGYLVEHGDDVGFAMVRRTWSENDSWPELEIYSKEKDKDKALKDLEKMASFLELPFPK